MDVFHPQVLNHTDTPSLDERLNYFCKCSPEDISGLVTIVIPEDRLPLQYLKSLSSEEKTICYWAAMVCWAVTHSTIVPPEMPCSSFRLSKMRLFDCHGNRQWEDFAYCNPAANFITIIVSPLKWLQVTQELDFNSHFQIPTITINEDTPHNIAWWNLNVSILVQYPTPHCIHSLTWPTFHIHGIWTCTSS